MIEHSLYDSDFSERLFPDYKKRRKDLYDRVVGKYQPSNPLLVLFANAEIENQRFVQDPTFSYRDWETSIITFVIGLGGYKKSDWDWMQHNGPKRSPAFDQKIKTLYQTNKSNIKTEPISNGC